MMAGPDRDTWQFINGFAGWLSSLSTIGAVVVALWLARRDTQARLRVSSGVYKLLAMGQKPMDAPSYFSVSAVNIGTREVVVNGITWRVGYLRKRKMVQIPPGPPLGPQLPLRLKHGDSAKFLVSLDDFYNGVSTVREVVAGRAFPWIAARTIRVGVYLSTGEEIIARVDTNTRELILSGTKPPFT